MIKFHLCYASRLAFERALSLDLHCTGAMTGLAILELNSKKVGSGSVSVHFLPSLLLNSVGVGGWPFNLGQLFSIIINRTLVNYM